MLDPSIDNNELSCKKMNRGFKGIWIPKEIWLIEDLGAQEKMLWAEINSLDDSENGNEGCFASNAYLCKFMGIKERRLQEMLALLKSLDLVKDISFNGRQRVMKAVLPSKSRTSGVRKSAPQACTKMHPPIIGIDTSLDLSKDKYCPIIPKREIRPTKLDIKFNFVSGKFEGVHQKDIEAWKEAYPSMDYSRELAKAQIWMMDNQSKSSKKTLLRKFLSNWFAKADNDAFRKSSTQPIANKLSTQVQQNIDLMNEIFTEHPNLREKTKRYGDKCIVNPSKNLEAYFDINPEEFKRIFYNLVGVEDE